MSSPYPWLRLIAKAIIYVGLFAVIGWYLNHILLALLVAFASLVGINCVRLVQLFDWLSNSKPIPPPNSHGIWSDIYQKIYDANLKSLSKRKSLGEIVRQFRQGSEALPDAAVVVNENAEITWCNRLARIELGLNWSQDRQQKIHEVINNSDFDEFYTANRFELPLEIISPINVNKVLEFRAVPYTDNHLMILIRDVTRLTQIEKMRKDFVANVSHELKTPLTVITGYLEMLPENGNMPEPMMKKAIHEMRTQSLRMQSLIEELLVLSRIEASTERAFEKKVNVPNLLWQIQVEADALNRDRKHKIFFDIAPNLYVYGIETELRSAFSNLIFNAINYTPNGGVIEVKWRLKGGHAFLSVKDNGEGIADEDIHRLTERFYRVDKARSRTTGGSGLGLSIVKHVLSHHNSELFIQSTVGKGALFSCSFSPELTHLLDE